MENLIKVLFVQKVDDKFETESLWCIPKGENYVIDNIPFIAERVSLGDTIKVEFDSEDNANYFDDFVEVSGNTTIRIYPFDKLIIEEIRKRLFDLGCQSEVFLERKIIAVNVPFNVDFRPIKGVLDEGEKIGSWTYEESCLAHKI